MQLLRELRRQEKEAAVLEVSAVTAADLNDMTKQYLHSDARQWGLKNLKRQKWSHLLQNLKVLYQVKKIGLFGSYGWGDGQWMRDWASRFENAGAVIVGGEGVICVEAPDDEAVNACKKLGNELAAE